MRLAGMLFVALLPMCLSYTSAQEPACSPCLDGPEMFQRVQPVLRDDDRPTAGQIAASIRENGGELSDIAHDCVSPRVIQFRLIRVTARACSWGGRYPALLIGPDDEATADPAVIIAASGSSVEVLFEDAASASFFEAFSGLLKTDFDALYLEASNFDADRTADEARPN